MKQSLNVARAFKQHIGGRIPTPKKRSRIGINRTIPQHFHHQQQGVVTTTLPKERNLKKKVRSTIYKTSRGMLFEAKQTSCCLQ